jgi:DNA-binding response OmpR family regulator
MADGLRCHIELPLEQANVLAAPMTAGQSRENKPDRAPLILIVEDEALTALDIAEAMANAGFRVAGPAATIAAAQRYIAKEQPRLAILDSNLQGEKSTSLAEELASAGTSIVFLTGYETVSDLPPALVGAPVLHKPMASEKLVKIVREKLGQL